MFQFSVVSGISGDKSTIAHVTCSEESVACTCSMVFDLVDWMWSERVSSTNLLFCLVFWSTMDTASLRPRKPPWSHHLILRWVVSQNHSKDWNLVRVRYFCTFFLVDWRLNGLCFSHSNAGVSGLSTTEARRIDHPGWGYHLLHFYFLLSLFFSLQS